MDKKLTIISKKTLKQLYEGKSRLRNRENYRNL